MLKKSSARQLLSRLSLKAIAVALVALVIAVPSGAFAAKKAGLIGSKDIKSNAVTSKHIKNGTIAKRDLVKSLQNELTDTKRRLAKLEAAVATPGPQGPAGAAGAKGDLGAAGVNGANGNDGAKGDKGETGSKGDQGDKGDKGDDGLDGQDGTDGTDGADGDPGVPGPQGDPGQNSDGSYSRSVGASGDQGFSIQGVAGSGGNNGSVSITESGLQLSIAAPGGGFAGAYKPYSDKPLLSTLRTLSYQFATFDRLAGSKVTPTLKIDVENANACDSADLQCKNALKPNNGTTLVLEPTYTQDAISHGVIDGLALATKWWSTQGVVNAPNRDTFVPFATILAGNPNMRITRIYVEAGQNSAGFPWSAFAGSVSWMNVGFAGNKTNKFVFGSN